LHEGYQDRRESLNEQITVIVHILDHVHGLLDFSYQLEMEEYCADKPHYQHLVFSILEDEVRLEYLVAYQYHHDYLETEDE
jgi:hypothetical protein